MENSKSSCELCSLPATTYCESDRARLCWHCDGKVHKANFLVSKHCRTLLCHLCNKPTPWTASGPMLPPSLSFCVACASTTSSRHAAAVMTPVQSAHLPLAHDENDGAYTGGDDLDGDEEDDDNQVVEVGYNLSQLHLTAEVNCFGCSSISSYELRLG
uniref:B box-type domain-containing protein n=1 Tax=Chenopodium quinoa TaxID=63459 RepID=A0A803N6A0_CHEQI